MHSGVLRVARGASRAKAPPVAARRKLQGQRLERVEKMRMLVWILRECLVVCD